MKTNVADNNRIFVDRPLTNSTPANATPSLWMLSKDDHDYTEVALRMFLMFCLVASMVLGGLRITGEPAAVRETEGLNLSVKTLPVAPSLTNVSFRASFR